MNTGGKPTASGAAGTGGRPATVPMSANNTNAFHPASSSPNNMNGGPAVPAASQNLYQQYQGLLNNLTQQRQQQPQQQPQQGPVGGVFSQAQMQPQSQVGMGSPQFVQLFSSLMGATSNNTKNSNPKNNGGNAGSVSSSTGRNQECPTG